MLIDELSRQIQEHIDQEQRTRPQARALGDPVPNVDAITPEWLTAVLRRTWPTVTVADVTVEAVSQGTHHRHRLHLTLADNPSDAPTSLFTKSLPTLEARMIAGITGHARAEGRFYRQIRPELEIETPRCHESWFDRTSVAAMHVLEDLVATKDATFCDAETIVTHDMATEMVALLASVHGQFLDDPRLQTTLAWLAPFARWFRGGITKLGVDRYHEQAMDVAADRIPERLLRRRAELWQATLAALTVHETEPPTFLHSDVHIGNWYRTGDGHMGLCDWQCIAQGHWSRDLAYAVTTALTIEDRRAWEEDLVRTYARELSAASGVEVDFDEAFTGYRRQIPHALLMWTPTLCHSDLLPHMQSDETSLTMIERTTAAIDDLDSIGANA